MNMKDDWQNSNFAEAWDTDTARGNPTRPEQLDILASIVAENTKDGELVLDIGSGSGQAEEVIFQKNRSLKIIGIEFSGAMIHLATQRLSQFKDNFQVIERDIQEFNADDLPHGTYSSAFAIQVLHEIPHDKKIELLKKVYEILPSGGRMLIMDRIKVDYRKFGSVYATIWDRLNNNTELKSNKSYEQYREKMEAKDDYPATEEEYLQFLREAGFETATLQMHFDRALVCGIKK